MLQNTFVSNKKIYLAYNDFRKHIFSELAPRDSEFILYLLPWMLNVNHRNVPGFISDMEGPIAVFGAATDRMLIEREPVFKKMFNIKTPGRLMIPSARASFIQGIYTIGSAGTIGQTSASDCDIWICIDKDNFSDRMRRDLTRKTNLIKDWMDSQLKLPIYFFISDIDDIRNGNFGSLDEESSGSAQHNVLKEEFYRTSILISGKILLWWVCFDPDGDVDYDAFAVQYQNDVFGDYDFIDMGPLESIDHKEYFGATLWQFNKALTHPLKSVIKMLLLEMLIAAPGSDPLCHRFRTLILNQGQELSFYDPFVFTLIAVLKYKREIDPETFEFIKRCCYLRHEIKFYTKTAGIRETLAKEIFTLYPLKQNEVYRLNTFATWPMTEQLEFGEKILSLLTTIYREIIKTKRDSVNALTHRDMTIIGRKLAVCLERKPGKVDVMHKPSDNINLPNLTFNIKKNTWQVLTAGAALKPIIASENIVSCIAYLVWNDLYQTQNVHMMPNATPITIQEINNLAKRISELFGTFHIAGVDFENFLEPEKATKMLVIVSFEDSSADFKNINNFTLLYSNHWGELFSHRFHTPKKFKAFIEGNANIFFGVNTCYYVQRNSRYYEKVIERTKMLVSHIFSNITSLSAK
jgi:adenylate cyclase class 1